MHAGDGAALLRYPVVEHRRDQRARLDTQLRAHRRDQRLQLGREHHAAPAPQGVQRRDAQRVPAPAPARPSPRRPEREREHAAEPGQRRPVPEAPRLEHDPVSDEVAKLTPRAAQVRLAAPCSCTARRCKPGSGRCLDSGWSAAADEVDDRQAAGGRAGPRPARRRGLQTPSTSGPRCAIRSLMMSASFVTVRPAGSSSAIPHTSAPRPLKRLGAAGNVPVYIQVGTFLMVYQASSCSTRARPSFAQLAPVSPRRPSAPPPPDRVLPHVVGLHIHRRRRPADTRVSCRSNATTGSSKAMYSMDLFIVDKSLSGFFGSGERPMSAVDRMRQTSSSGARPVNSTWPASPSLSRRATSSS